MFNRLFVFALISSSLFAVDASRPVLHVNNLGIVNEHLWRGAEPSATGLADLGTAGVKSIIDLRESGVGTHLEKEEAEKLNIMYINVPFPPASAPSPAQIQQVLDMLAENPSQTIFVHCRRGKDRTGTVIACYRIQHDGWSNSRALDEAKSFGMSSMERGMRAFILHYTPVLAAAKPGIF